VTRPGTGALSRPLLAPAGAHRILGASGGPARDAGLFEAPWPASDPDPNAESVRALLAASGEPSCGNCGTPLAGRQRLACSARCRAVLSRNRQAKSRAARDQQIRMPLVTAQRMTSDPQVRRLIQRALRVLNESRAQVIKPR
jgi:predicted nucleic acid-binding Zn ribbon protein